MEISQWTTRGSRSVAGELGRSDPLYCPRRYINIWKTAAVWVIRVRMLAVQPLGPAENLIQAKTEVLTDIERVTAAFKEDSLGQAASSPRTTLGSILTSYTNASLTPGYHFR